MSEQLILEWSRESFTLQGNQSFIIGSGQVSIRVQQDSIRDRHARIKPLDSGWVIEPLDGDVIVNAYAVKSHALLQAGMLIRLGDVDFTVKVSNTSQNPPLKRPPDLHSYVPPPQQAPPSRSYVPPPQQSPSVKQAPPQLYSYVPPPLPQKQQIIPYHGQQPFNQPVQQQQLNTPPPVRRKGNPHLYGRVIDVTVTQMQKNDPTNSARTAFGLMLLPFRPLMAIMMLLNRNPQEVQMVTTVRVQQISGQLREARIEHDLMAGSIGRGDDVSLWGTTSGAVLFVAEGYNHTTSADIRLVGVAPSFLRNLVRFLGMVMAAFVVYLVCVLILSVINRS